MLVKLLEMAVLFWIGVGALIIVAILLQARYDNVQAKLSDEYIRLLEEGGFVCPEQAIACMESIATGDYRRAVRLLQHPELYGVPTEQEEEESNHG